MGFVWHGGHLVAYGATLINTGLARLIRQAIAETLAALSLIKVQSLEAQASEVSTVRVPRRAGTFDILKSRKIVIVYVRLSRGWMCG